MATAAATTTTCVAFQTPAAWSSPLSSTPTPTHTHTLHHHICPATNAAAVPVNYSSFHGRPVRRCLVAKRVRRTPCPFHMSSGSDQSESGDGDSESDGDDGEVVQYFGGPSPGQARNERKADQSEEGDTDTDSGIPEIEKTTSSSSPASASSSSSPSSPSPSPSSAASSSSESPVVPDAFPSTLGKIEDTSEFEELPLFPLQLVMTPGSQIPLHIFEMRYRQLFNRLRDVSESEGAETGRFGIVLSGERLALVGCVAQVTNFEMLPDGRMLTTNVGRERFRIVRIVEEKPYIVAKVAPVVDEPPRENTAPLVLDVWSTLNDVLRLSNRLYDKKLDFGQELKNVDPGEHGQALVLNDKGWPTPAHVERFSFAVSQILDMPLKDQQLMLQTTNTAQRLRKQVELLTTARQYLAAQLTIKDAGLKGF